MFSTFVGPLGIVFYLNSILNNCCSWNMYDNAERQKVLYCTLYCALFTKIMKELRVNSLHNENVL